MMAQSPFTQRILDAVVPPLARWLVAHMRRMEEASLNAESRWATLREALEQIGREDTR